MEAAQEVPENTGEQAGGRRWSFASAEFDERTFELRVAGTPVELERKSLEVLRQLLYRAGEVVTKDELLETVWPGRIVSESIPAKCVSRIREVIGDDAQAVIKTVHGYGYRLVAPVTVEAVRPSSARPRLSLDAGDHPPLRPLWSLVRRLGSGGQGEVWLVRHDKTREERIYKFALDVAGLAAIKREITLYRFLSDTLGKRDEFARVLDWNLEELPYFIELEHAGGGNLESWAEAHGGLDNVALDQRLEIIAKIADALAAAHSVGVLHKDLKPSNVLIVTEGTGAPRVKLTDFGSGGVLDPQRLEALGITRLGFTKSVMQGSVATTALYLAPEVTTGQPATVQADVYSLGIMLYQISVGDFKQPLTSGWEHRVSDPILREDIALAVAGDPARRLADAAALANRLRTLDERRRQRAAELAEKVRLEQEQQAAHQRARQAELTVARLRARRNWMLTALSVLIVGFAFSFALYLEAQRARNEAAAAAASSQAVADFLSKDMFAQVAARPLRNLTVKDLLDVASATLGGRPGLMPEAAAQIHAALGNAFFTVDAYAEAESHLEKAFDFYQQLEGTGSESGVAVAAQLVSAKSILSRAPDDFSRFDPIVQRATDRLGAQHPALLNLKQTLGYQRLKSGDFTGAVKEFGSLVTAAMLTPQPNQLAVGEARRFLAHALLLQGAFEESVKEFGDSLAKLGALPESPPMGIVTARLLRAQALIELERFDEASADLSAAEERIHDWVLDDRNSQVLAIQFISAQLALRQGRTNEAIERLEHLLRRVEASGWNAQSDQTAEPRRWLAQAYLEAGRADQAEVMMRKAREVAAQAFGPATPWYQLATIGLADAVRLRGRTAQAREILASVDHTVFQRLGSDHPFTAELQRIEGLIALAEGHAQDARGALGEAARIFDLRYGSRHTLSKRARADLAAVAGQAAVSAVPN